MIYLFWIFLMQENLILSVPWAPLASTEAYEPPAEYIFNCIKQNIFDYKENQLY